MPDHVLAVAIRQPEIEDNDIRTVRRDALDEFGDRPGAAAELYQLAIAAKITRLRTFGWPPRNDPDCLA